ncbi:MAG: BamA/TamA family outer membrane protein [Rickettsiaceae bacterium]|nr:BamA/TamA family outer membrane protein [Rickettsiaceae bacterium]
MQYNPILKIILITILLCVPCQSTFAAKKINLVLKLHSEEEIIHKLTKALLSLENSANSEVTVKQVDYWEKEAEQVLYKILRAYGYYGANIESTRLEDENTKMLTFEIILGNRYTIQEINFDFAVNSNQSVNNIAIDQLKTQRGDPINAYIIQEDQNKIAAFLEKNNCLLESSVSHRALIDHINEQLTINFIIDAGPNTEIKDIYFQGLKTLNETYLKKLIQLKPNQCFRQSQIISAVGDLHSSGLLLSASPVIPDEVDENGQVPVIFNVQERKMRSIKLGINYSTDKDLKLTGSLEWKHQNLFGNGENLKVRLNGNKSKQELEMHYQKPFFMHDNQTLDIKGEYNYKDIKAYNAKIGSIATLLNHKINSDWNTGIGARLAHSKEKEFANNKPMQTFSLSSLPIYIEYDKRNNIINTEQGLLARLDFIPFNSKRRGKLYDINLDHTNSPMSPPANTSDITELIDIPETKSHINFSKIILQGNIYHSFNNNLTIALKGRSGSILAQRNKINDISVTEKFFLGGNNSVRGYQYNTIGLLDHNNKIIGGFSFIELSTELRIKMKNNFGIVSFIDAGNVSLSKTPELKNLLYGIGLGIRYYTSFAPLRLDVAFPLKKRKGIDKRIQIYLGIGQSF